MAKIAGSCKIMHIAICVLRAMFLQFCGTAVRLEASAERTESHKGEDAMVHRFAILVLAFGAWSCGGADSGEELQQYVKTIQQFNH